jgi:endonuclease/exonuclease/phosphatase family metal-dependent hydrolase
MMMARGVVLLNEPFDYTNGPLVSVSGGKWVHHNGATTGEVNVVFGHGFLTQTETEDVSATLAGQPYAATTNILLYSSFNLNLSAAPLGTGNCFAHYKAAGTSGQQAGKVFVTTNGVAAGFFRVGVANSANSPVAVVNSDLSYDTDYWLVTRYAPSNSATTLWLNPSAEADASITATDPATAISVVAFALRQSLSSGNGMGSLYLDELRVGTSFSDVITNAPPQPPAIVSQPQSQAANEGTSASFTVVATGSLPLSYQWQFNSANLAGATNSALMLTNVTAAHAGTYTVTVTNSLGSATSQPATLTVNPPATPGFSLLTYNVGGNGAADWSTNSAQVQAIARVLQFLNPDIITFQEIPFDQSCEMTNFVSVFLPGYALARNSGTDGAIRSMIASRFPIARSTSWLDGIDLRGFGYSNVNNSLDNFTRDLFEAEIDVPGFPQPLHVFTTHLKSTSGTTYADAAAKRAAEAAAITNFLATNLIALYPNQPYLLAGDMNDSDTNALAIQSLLTPPTGLALTTPTNEFTGSLNTFSIRASLSSRLDYFFPGGLLRSNIAGSQVFRSDLLPNPPPPLLTSDSATASDHLPVLMVFNNPYDKPFRLTSVTHSNTSVTLTWESVPGQPYRVDSSSNLTAWSVLANDLVATGDNYTFRTNVSDNQRFFRTYRAP